jgi:hypothetical protein
MQRLKHQKMSIDPDYLGYSSPEDYKALHARLKKHKGTLKELYVIDHPVQHEDTVTHNYHYFRALVETEALGDERWWCVKGRGTWRSNGRKHHYTKVVRIQPSEFLPGSYEVCEKSPRGFLYGLPYVTREVVETDFNVKVLNSTRFVGCFTEYENERGEPFILYSEYRKK